LAPAVVDEEHWEVDGDEEEPDASEIDAMLEMIANERTRSRRPEDSSGLAHAVGGRGNNTMVYSLQREQQEEQEQQHVPPPQQQQPPPPQQQQQQHGSGSGGGGAVYPDVVGDSATPTHSKQKKVRVCRHFARGTCRKGAGCPYRHEHPSSMLGGLRHPDEWPTSLGDAQHQLLGIPADDSTDEAGRPLFSSS
jgi:hypothetical protein